MFKVNEVPSSRYIELKFLKISLPNVTLHDARFILKTLLRSAIKNRKKELGLFRKKVAVYEKDLAKTLCSINKYTLDNTFKKIVYKLAIKTIKTHEKMLRNLTKNVTLPRNPNKTGLFESSFFWGDQFDPPSYFKKN